MPHACPRVPLRRALHIPERCMNPICQTRPWQPPDSIRRSSTCLAARLLHDRPPRLPPCWRRVLRASSVMWAIVPTSSTALELLGDNHYPMQLDHHAASASCSAQIDTVEKAATSAEVTKRRSQSASLERVQPRIAATTGTRPIPAVTGDCEFAAHVNITAELSNDATRTSEAKDTRMTLMLIPSSRTTSVTVRHLRGEEPPRLRCKQRV